MSAITLYSEDWPERATLDPTQKQAAYALRELYRRQPPGGWSDNRMEQAQHFKGVIHCAISAIMDLMLSASFEVQKRRRPRRNRTTFGKSTVAKSMGQSQHQGRDEEYEPLEDYDHPLARVIYQPNPNETMAELAVKLVQQNRLTGVGPLWAIPNDEGQPVQLWALKTPLIQPIWQLSKQYPYGAWRVLPYAGVGWMGYTPPGFGTAGAILPGEQVRRWLCPHPLIDWDGFSPLTAGAVQLDVLESIDDSRKSAMDNGLQLDAMLIAPGMEQAVLDRIVAQMTEKHGGARNARKFAAIAPSLGMTDRAKLETYGTTPREMDYNQSWDQMIKFALALFGVPAPVAGLADTTSYSELFASIRQFHARQSAYFIGFETWLTKTLAWPYCDEPGEYCVKVKLPPVDDVEMRETQFSRQLQYDLLSFNEARAKDDMPPVEGGDVPVSVYVQMKQQAAAPQPVPGALPGAPPGDESAPVPTSDDGQSVRDGGDDAGEDVPDEMLAAALEELGVPGETGETVQKAAPWEESKHKRDHGKFSAKDGGKGQPATSDGTGSALATAQAKEYQRLRDAGHSHGDALQASQEIRPGSAPTQAQPKPTSPRVSQIAQRAKSSTAVKDQLARAHEWADRMAEMHADRVAKHLGIDRASAKHVLASTIKMLCERALRGEGDAQSATYTGKGGQKVTIGVKRKGPTSGAVPGERNPQGQGTRPPIEKGMNGMVGSAGGFLVPPQTAGRGKMKKRRRLKAVLNRTLKALGG